MSGFPYEGPGLYARDNNEYCSLKYFFYRYSIKALAVRKGLIYNSTVVQNKFFNYAKGKLG